MKAIFEKLSLSNMSAPVRRRLFVTAVGIVVALLIGYGFIPKPVIVDAVPAMRGTLRVTVEEEGRTRVKDRFVVSAPVPGYLRRITLKVGDLVRKGARVAALEPLRSVVLDPRSRAEAEAAVDAARGALSAVEEQARAATADAEYAREREARMKKLVESGYVAADVYDQTRADAKRTEALRLSADAAVIAAKAELERAESVLRFSAAGGKGDTRETVIVLSPVNGSVLKLHRESEGVVNSGEPLLDLGDPRNLEVRVEVLSADAVKIKPGMTVLFERWGGDAMLEGKVQVVEPAGFTKISSLGVEEQRVLAIVAFTSPIKVWERLGDAYRLDATFVIWEGKAVLQVPASALFRQGEGWAVFAVQNKRARLQDVEIGRRNGLVAEIVQGLSEGTMVIMHPDDTVQDGVRVKVR